MKLTQRPHRIPTASLSRPYSVITASLQRSRRAQEVPTARTRCENCSPLAFFDVEDVVDNSIFSSTQYNVILCNYAFDRKARRVNQDNGT